MKLFKDIKPCIVARLVLASLGTTGLPAFAGPVAQSLQINGDVKSSLSLKPNDH